ncbi:MAG: helix-turn-helix transcriptional regulator [bacterium]
MNSFHQSTSTAGRRLIASAEHRRRMGGISEMTRWRHEKARIGPEPIKLNGRNYYFEDETEAYLEELAASRHRDGDDLSADADAPTVSADDTPAIGKVGGAAKRIAATDPNEGA